jgi:hypothetical protein
MLEFAFSVTVWSASLPLAARLVTLDP